MASISDSTHKILSDQIALLGLSERFIVEKSTIYGINGSEFRFIGVKNNVSAVKSYEGIDICWIAEAHNVSRDSWETIIPTIRKDGSQIIVDFNANNFEDDTYQRFVVSPPPDSVVVKINYDENPFFTDVLRQEMEYMKASDPDAYQNVWLGHPKIVLDSAVYAKELRLMQEEQRIRFVPYDTFTPVHCFYDLGWRDYTSVVLAQKTAFEYRIIDFIEINQTKMSDVIGLLQRKPYTYGVHYLPHDAGAMSLQTGRSIEQIMRTDHKLSVRVVPRHSLIDGVNAVRQMMASMFIDETKCSKLLGHLRKYSYDLESKRPVPIHDEHSHAADAVRLMAMSLRDPLPPIKEPEVFINTAEAGWMS